MTQEQKETLSELIKTNPAGASAYLEAITGNQNNEPKSEIQKALEIQKAHQEKLNQLKK